MFVQVIQGQGGRRRAGACGARPVGEGAAPGATGWPRPTTGVTEDGQFIAVARFESDEAARRNSDRPEQDAWWAQTSKLFTGEAAFQDSSNVIVDMTGDPDRPASSRSRRRAPTRPVRGS